MHMHGGLICIALRLSVYLSVCLVSLDQNSGLENNSLENNSGQDKGASNSMMAITNCNSGGKSISHVTITGRCAQFNIKLHFFRSCDVLFCKEVNFMGQIKLFTINIVIFMLSFRSLLRPNTE